MENKCLAKQGKGFYTWAADSFSGIAEFDSNRSALNVARAFAQGFTSFAAIVGPSGWGKTLLLHSTEKALQKRFPGDVKRLSCSDFLSNAQLYQKTRVLILDDVQEIYHSLKNRQLFFRHLEQRIRTGKPTFLAASPNGLTTLRSLLPSPSRWQVVTLDEPNIEEKVSAVREICHLEGIHLRPEAIRLIAKSVAGNGRSLLGALTRLKISVGNKLKRLDPLRLMGLLEPYLAEKTYAHLKELTEEAISRCMNLRICKGKPKCSLMLAIYILRGVAEIGEEKVATLLDVAPGEVFRLYKQCERALKDGEPGLKNCISRCLSRIRKNLYG
ncbi:MAG TPA: DnaA/Hda family protein [Fimbriimonadales bacterium]|nr:DnaA/Hda family protein [Fimbriimonadales bacterium]